MSDLKRYFKESVSPELLKKFEYKNVHQIPSLKKIVLSMGIAEAVKDKNILDSHKKELALIAGQKPIETLSKKAISNFKLRIGQPIGLMVVLRQAKMWSFLSRFINIAAPRIRDFRGLKRKGDGRGAYHLGIEDHQIFPELNLDEVKRVQGMNLAFVTNAETEDECLYLLELLGLPFKSVEK